MFIAICVLLALVLIIGGIAWSANDALNRSRKANSDLKKRLADADVDPGQTPPDPEQTKERGVRSEYIIGTEDKMVVLSVSGIFTSWLSPSAARKTALRLLQMADIIDPTNKTVEPEAAQ